MARVTVQVYTIMREKLGTGKVDVSADTAAAALREMEKTYGPVFRDLLYSGNSIKSHYMLLVNGRSVDRNRLDGIELRDGDVLHIFPPIAGG